MEANPSQEILTAPSGMETSEGRFASQSSNLHGRVPNYNNNQLHHFQLLETRDDVLWNTIAKQLVQ